MHATDVHERLSVQVLCNYIHTENIKYFAIKQHGLSKLSKMTTPATTIADYMGCIQQLKVTTIPSATLPNPSNRRRQAAQPSLGNQCLFKWHIRPVYEDGENAALLARVRSFLKGLCKWPPTCSKR